MQSFRAPKADRLDRLLRSLEFPGSVWMSRAGWDEALTRGRVRVNGRPVKKGGATLAEGDEITLDLGALGLLPAAQPARLVWASEAKDLAVFSKDVGKPTYPLFPWEEGTLAHEVAAFAEREGWLSAADFAALAPAPILEGGLLQRLDRDTSGLVACAFTAEAKARYRPLFSGQVEKGYLALVASAPGLEGEHRIFFRTSEAAKVQASREEKPGSTAVTLTVRVPSAEGAYAFVEVETSQGLRHVVRAGLAALGAPLVGDALYGGAPEAAFHQLHAAWLKIPGLPVLRDPPPEGFLACASRLGLKSNPA